MHGTTLATWKQVDAETIIESERVEGFFLEVLPKIVTEQGFIALIVIALAVYLFKKDNYHRNERREWKDMLIGMHKESTTVVKDNTEVMRDMTNMLHEMKTITEGLRK